MYRTVEYDSHSTVKRAVTEQIRSRNWSPSVVCKFIFQRQYTIYVVLYNLFKFLYGFRGWVSFHSLLHLLYEICSCLDFRKTITPLFKLYTCVARDL